LCLCNATVASSHKLATLAHARARAHTHIDPTPPRASTHTTPKPEPSPPHVTKTHMDTRMKVPSHRPPHAHRSGLQAHSQRFAARHFNVCRALCDSVAGPVSPSVDAIGHRLATVETVCDIGNDSNVRRSDLRRYFLAFRCTFAGPPTPLGAAELWPLVLCLAAVAFRDRVFIIAARVEVPAPSTPQPLRCSAITHTPTHAVSAAPTCGSTGTAVCTLRCTDTCCSHSALQATTTRRSPSASAFSWVTLPYVRLRLA
jgi:hypothetical protein